MLDDERGSQDRMDSCNEEAQQLGPYSWLQCFALSPYGRTEDHLMAGQEESLPL